ncbi:hypothetical protein BDM02DRAFT_2470833 [Thelephora ganbajun]|uniref:Uncharacterized protein n=1 Tax=Thelephora ganbajun TaxID=370292 RepID=A0ACB6YXU8_THEGA|nr:hypothetical protein BDM02DRAFT_2470833 [Thelephora ganbajun]
MFPRMSPIMNPLSPATQCDILGILQREQDRAMELLSSSPLLASLFVSYANQAAALESALATPSPESDEWKALQNTISTLEEKIEKSKSEDLEIVERLEVATASQEAFRSQVSSLREVNATQQDDIKSLRAELIEVKGKHDRLLVESNAERAGLQGMVLDLEVQRTELKETVVEQQIKISKLERQGFGGPSIPPKAAATIETVDPREHDSPRVRSTAAVPTRFAASRSEKERLTDLALCSPPTGPIPLSLSTEPTPEAPLKLEVKDEIPATPRLGPSPSLTPVLQGSSGGGNWPSIATPTIVEDRQTVPTEIAPDQKGESQQEVVAGGPSAFGPGRRNKKKGGGMARPVAVATPPSVPTYPQKNAVWSWFDDPAYKNPAPVRPRSPEPFPTPTLN